MSFPSDALLSLLNFLRGKGEFSFDAAFELLKYSFEIYKKNVVSMTAPELIDSFVVSADSAPSYQTEEDLVLAALNDHDQVEGAVTFTPGIWLAVASLVIKILLEKFGK